ncbi:hypothetical protein [Fodinicola acaciae]|uniref:hypothetical protein n=1 Tax=Fodinicola acaciae TaxID=2681555 RepID=UPI0013D77CF4|nr:hypothetical protein [Fodinicola acaciae]
MPLRGFGLGGVTYEVTGPRQPRGSDGVSATFPVGGAFGYDPAAGTLTLTADGTRGRLTVCAARLNPPAGEAFEPITFDGFTVYASSRGFRTPDHAAVQAYGRRSWPH